MFSSGASNIHVCGCRTSFRRATDKERRPSPYTRSTGRIPAIAGKCRPADLGGPAAVGVFERHRRLPQRSSPQSLRASVAPGRRCRPIPNTFGVASVALGLSSPIARPRRGHDVNRLPRRPTPAEAQLSRVVLVAAWPRIAYLIVSLRPGELGLRGRCARAGRDAGDRVALIPDALARTAFELAARVAGLRRRRRRGYAAATAPATRRRATTAATDRLRRLAGGATSTAASAAPTAAACGARQARRWPAARTVAAGVNGCILRLRRRRTSAPAARRRPGGGSEPAARRSPLVSGGGAHRAVRRARPTVWRRRRFGGGAGGGGAGGGISRRRRLGGGGAASAASAAARARRRRSLGSGGDGCGARRRWRRRRLRRRPCAQAAVADATIVLDVLDDVDDVEHLVVVAEGATS